MTSETVKIFINHRKIATTNLQIYLIILNRFHSTPSLAAGTTSDMMRRRYTILFSLVIFSVASLVSSLAQIMVFGWFLVGTRVSYTHTVVPVYITEFSADSTREFLKSFVEVYVNVEVLVENVSACTFPKIINSKSELAIHVWTRNDPFAFTVTGCNVFFFFLPESHCWLVTRGRFSEVKRVVIKTSNG